MVAKNGAGGQFWSVWDFGLKTWIIESKRFVYSKPVFDKDSFSVKSLSSVFVRNSPPVTIRTHTSVVTAMPTGSEKDPEKTAGWITVDTDRRWRLPPT